MTTDDVFMPPVPQVTMNESRFDNNVKREGSEVSGSSRPHSPMPMRGNFGEFPKISMKSQQNELTKNVFSNKLQPTSTIQL